MEKVGPQKGSKNQYRKRPGNQTHREAGRPELSRRQTKQEQRRPETDAPRQPNHKTKWREAISETASANQEEQKVQVLWLMGNLEQMTVPAF